MRAFDWRQLKFFRSVWIRSFPSTIPKRYRLLLSFEIHQFAAAHHVMWSTVIVSYSSVFFLFLFSRQKLRSHFRSHTKQLTVIDSFCSFDVAVGGCDGGDSGGGGDRFRFEIFQWTFHWVISFCHWGFTSLYHLQFDVSFTFQFLSLTLLSPRLFLFFFVGVDDLVTMRKHCVRNFWFWEISRWRRFTLSSLHNRLISVWTDCHRDRHHYYRCVFAFLRQINEFTEPNYERAISKWTRRRWPQQQRERQRQQQQCRAIITVRKSREVSSCVCVHLMQSTRLIVSINNLYGHRSHVVLYTLTQFTK